MTNASQVADIAAADFLISYGSPFSLSEDPSLRDSLKLGET